MNLKYADGDKTIGNHECHASNGRLFVSTSFLKKLRRKRVRTRMSDDLRTEIRKGFDNERRFRAMFGRLASGGYLPPGCSLRKATRNQDENFKVDFWIDLLREHGPKLSIPVQIKSSWYGRAQFTRKFGSRVKDIRVIVMDAEINLCSLLPVILKIIAMELNREHDEVSTAAD